MAFSGAVMLVGSLASAGVAAYSASQQGSIAGQQEGMAQTVFGEQQGYAQQLASLINNPSSVTSLPGYQFNFGQGTDAVTREMASSGFSGSGNEAIALTQYGQGNAQNTFNQYASLLSSLAGLSSPVNPTGALGGASSANTAGYNQYGGALASLGFMAGQNNSGAGLGGFGGGWGGGGGSSGWIPNSGGLTYDTGFAGTVS
jgi:hypothetical protein